MALIPPAYKDAVVAICCHRKDGSLLAVGTGFLYAIPNGVDPADGRTWFRTYTVTNRHVLFSESGAPNERLFMRFHSSGSELPYFDLPRASEWVCHPDETVDVAAIGTNITYVHEHGASVNAFQPDNVLFRDQAIREGLTEGCGVFTVGFPLGLIGQRRNYPLVRHGVIARIQDWFDGESQSFLVDSMLFPGNSGGPVVSKPELTAITGTNRLARSALLGVATAYEPYVDQLVSQQTGDVMTLTRENSGLGVVVPVDLVDEVVRLAASKSRLNPLPGS